MDDTNRRDLVERHHVASSRGDMDEVHAIYHEDAVIEYPQSGERILGRHKLRGLRESHPAKLDFSIRRIVGSGDVWITEYVISYDGKPVNTISIMEFEGDQVARETLYFADPFDAPDWRSQWVEIGPQE
ncbi:MAG TPA: nuclear transport factor 2 family protein [Gaiellaceae bacterium]|nr:nuclear transport factor 2 family protein [Gaiellaceae bacterium]